MKIIILFVTMLGCTCYAEEQKTTLIKLLSGEELQIVEVLEKAPDGVSVKTSEGKVTFVAYKKMNTESKTLLGYNKNEEERLKKQISASAKTMKIEADKKKAETDKKVKEDKLASISKDVCGKMVMKVRGGIIVECEDLQRPRSPKMITTSASRIGGDSATTKRNSDAMEAYNKEVKLIDAKNEKRAHGRIFLKDYPDADKKADGDMIETVAYENGVIDKYTTTTGGIFEESLHAYSCKVPDNP